MATKYTGALNFSNGIHFGANVPLDDRCVVESLTDLLNVDTWYLGGKACIAYRGMVVSTADTGQLYTLKVEPTKENIVLSSSWATPSMEITTVPLRESVGLTRITESDLTEVNGKTYITSTLDEEEGVFTVTEDSIEAKVGDFIAADGTLAEDGVASAADVAYEIANDELVIATALNDLYTLVSGIKESKETFVGNSGTVPTWTSGSDEVSTPKVSATLTGDNVYGLINPSLAATQISNYVDGAIAIAKAEIEHDLDWIEL